MAARKYNWSNWFRRGRFRLRAGIDYVCSTDAMVQQIHNAASRCGVHVRIVLHDDGVTGLVVRQDARTWNTRPKKNAVGISAN